MGRRWLVLVTTGACAIGGGGCGRDLGRSLSASGGGAGSGGSPACHPPCVAGAVQRWARAGVHAHALSRPGGATVHAMRDARVGHALDADAVARRKPAGCRTPTGTVRLLDTASWREVAQLASPIGRMDALAFSPDGRQLATLTQETGILALWRSEDGAFLQSFAGSAASTIYTTATQVAFSSDGKQLMSSLGTQVALDGANTLRRGPRQRRLPDAVRRRDDTAVALRRC